MMLEVRNLTVTYDARGAANEAVKNVSFAVAENSFCGLIGESGSGKSSACSRRERRRAAKFYTRGGTSSACPKASSRPCASAKSRSCRRGR